MVAGYQADVDLDDFTPAIANIKVNNIIYLQQKIKIIIKNKKIKKTFMYVQKYF